MQMNDFVVRFAGEGGQGVVTSAEGLAQASTQVGYHALTYATFPFPDSRWPDLDPSPNMYRADLEFR